ncbi:MAG: glutamate--tRNA ligase family protein [Rhizomicrobium sp.]
MPSPRSRRGRRERAFLLRIEDIDTARCREEFVDAIFEDLHWLGLDWEEPVLRQSARGDAYRAALDRLDALGLTYPCFCTRKEIASEIARAIEAPQGPDGPVYPGTCRHLPREERDEKIAAGLAYALRLDVCEGRRTDRSARLRGIGCRPQGRVRRHRREPAAVRRHRAGEEGHAGGLSPRRRGRRRRPGRDPGHPRQTICSRRPMCSFCCRRCWICRRPATPITA